MSTAFEVTPGPHPPALARALPADCYVGEASDGRDRSAVFARSWQLVAAQSALQRPGDHVLATVAQVPLVPLLQVVELIEVHGPQRPP